jgi:dienelactone hydrolase
VTRNYSPWAYWRLRLDAVPAPPLPPVDNRAALEEWRTAVRATLHELLGPLPPPVPLNLEVLSEVDAGGYRRVHVVFDTEPAMSVPALLLIPDGRTERVPGPAVLAIHGHGHTKESVCGLDGGSTETRQRIADDCANYGERQVRRGYVVLAPDLRCFGERADWQPQDHYHCDTNLVHAVAAGEQPLTQNLWDLARCLDVLAARPDVDADHIGVVGWSYGGTLALFLAALDERAAATVVSCFFSSWQAAHRVPWNLCGSQVLAGMLGRIEHRDLAALVAPRPLLLSSGEADVLFPADVARAEAANVAAVYAALDSEDRLAHDVFDGEHRWDEVPAEAFLDRWLPVV